MGRVDERHGDKGGNLDQILKIAEVFMCCVSIQDSESARWGASLYQRCASKAVPFPSPLLPPHRLTLHVR